MNLKTIYDTARLFRNLSVSNSRRGVKSLVDIPWVRPIRPPCNSPGPDGSGDLVGHEPLPPSTPAPLYKDAPSLKEANDLVKTVFSIGHQGTYPTNKAAIDKLADRVRNHKYDSSTMEVKIAKMTAKIRYWQVYLEAHPRNMFVKNECKELIQRRGKFLRLLRKNDYKRFEWILEKLDIVYKPPPVDQSEPITRKKSLVRLLELQCEEIKNKKMSAYKKSLLIKREQLLKEFSQNPI